MRKNKKRHRKHPGIARRTQPGASPGTVAVDPDAKKPRIQIVAYGDDGFVEREISQLAMIPDFLKTYSITWVNVDGLGDAETIEKIGEIFGLHRLALEDVVNTHQRAKVDTYDNCLFIVARMPDLEMKADTEQLGMFVGDKFVITFQEAEGDCWEPVRQRLRQRVGKIRERGPDYLAYALLDAVIDSYFPVLEHYGERLDAVEDAVVFAPSRRSLDELHRVKGELLMLRRAIWPHREAMAMLGREATPFFTDSTRIFIRDCYDHVIQITELLETYRELTADLRDLYMSSVSNKINDTMRVLTIIATIFIPITFIASIYGMNFPNIPEFRWRWGYQACLLLMALVAGGMCLYFWKQGWLTSTEKALPKHRHESSES